MSVGIYKLENPIDDGPQNKVVKKWTKLLGTVSNDEANGVATMPDGNIYITGYAYGNLDGQTNEGSYDVFLTKYNLDGNKIWTRLLGTGNNDQATGTTTPDGSIYITGFTFGDLDGQTFIGLNDVFLTKYNLDGNKIWTRLLGTGNIDAGYGVATHLREIYITGYTDGDLDGQTREGSRDAFLAKYNPDGDIVWTRLLGTGNNEQANTGVTTTPDGSIYITDILVVI